MKNAIAFFVIYIVFASSVFANTTVLDLKNGRKVVFENNLPESISGFYASDDLIQRLDKPPEGFITEYPFNCRIVLGWNEEHEVITISLLIPVSAASGVISLNEYNDGIYFDLKDAYFYLSNIAWWAGFVPMNKAKDIEPTVLTKLYTKKIQCWVVFCGDDNELEFPFLFQFNDDGVFRDPSMVLQYPIRFGSRDIYPPEMTVYEYKTRWADFLRYPMGHEIDPITKRENSGVSRLISFLEIPVIPMKVAVDLQAETRRLIEANDPSTLSYIQEKHPDLSLICEWLIATKNMYWIDQFAKSGYFSARGQRGDLEHSVLAGVDSDIVGVILKSQKHENISSGFGLDFYSVFFKNYSELIPDLVARDYEGVVTFVRRNYDPIIALEIAKNIRIEGVVELFGIMASKQDYDSIKSLFGIRDDWWDDAIISRVCSWNLIDMKSTILQIIRTERFVRMASSARIPRRQTVTRPIDYSPMEKAEVIVNTIYDYLVEKNDLRSVEYIRSLTVK